MEFILGIQLCLWTCTLEKVSYNNSNSIAVTTSFPNKFERKQTSFCFDHRGNNQHGVWMLSQCTGKKLRPLVSSGRRGVNNISLSPWKNRRESGQVDMGMVKQGQAIKCNRSNLHLTVNSRLGVAAGWGVWGGEAHWKIKSRKYQKSQSSAWWGSTV